jgi:hypothetical protein
LDTTDDYNSISIYKLNEWNYIPLNDKSFFTNAGTLTWSSWKGESTVSTATYKHAGEAHIVFNYTATDRQTGEAESVHHKFELVSTPCNLGGFRYWFSCYCGKRVGILYIDGRYIGCRNCFHLTYQTRKETRTSKLEPLRKALEYELKLRTLDDKIKVRDYNGRPTRKQRQLEKIYRKYEYYARQLQRPSSLF